MADALTTWLMIVTDNHQLKASGEGDISFFKRVKYYPQISQNLLSERLMFNQGWHFRQMDNGDKIASIIHNGARHQIHFHYDMRYWTADLLITGPAICEPVARFPNDICHVSNSSVTSNSPKDNTVSSSNEALFIQRHPSTRIYFLHPRWMPP